MRPIKRWQATALLLCFPMIAFWKILLAHNDYSFFTSNDAAQHWYPWYQYIARWIHAGVLPLWDTDLQAGRPLLGEMRPGVLYPLNLLFFRLLSAKEGIGLFSMDLYVVLEIVLASVFQYHLARQLSLSRYAALLSAAIYGYSGYIVENATWQIAIFHGIIWLPLLVLFFIRAGESAGLRRVVRLLTCGVIFGMIILAGHIQPPVHAALCLALMAACYPFASGSPRSRRRDLAGRAARLGSCFFIGLVVASPQLVIAWEYGKRSLRWLGWDALPPVSGAGEIPYAWGGHFERGHLQDVFTAINPGTWAGSDYFGVAPVLLALVAFLLVRESSARFFKVLLGFSILLWLGELSVFHGFLYQMLPLMDKVRQPSRAIFLIHFCVATLGGFGADALARSIRKADKESHQQLARILVWVGSFATASIGVAGMLAVLFKVTTMTDQGLEWTLRSAFLILISVTIFHLRQVGRLRLHAFRVLLLIVVMTDLFSVFSYAILSRFGYNDKNNFFPSVHYAGDQATGFLASNARRSLFRVEVLDDALPPNAGMVHAYQEITGGMATGLAEYHKFLALDPSPHSVVRRLLNRRYIVSRSNLAGFDQVLTGPPAVFEDRSALERATWIPGVMIVDSRESVANALRRQDFDPRATVLVTGDEGGLIPPELRVASFQPAPTTAQARVRFTSYQPNRIVLTWDAERAGILLFSEIAYPGWRATVDGARVPIFTADYLFRAILAEKGMHTVELAYEPRLFSPALRLSTASFLLTCILALILAGRNAVGARLDSKSAHGSPSKAGQ